MQLLDRIAEAYNGQLGNLAHNNSRMRIDWICKHVRGKSVLDIGCSQGICELLLARNGFQITGIDVVRESIEYARRLIDEEPFEVKHRVQLHCADFLTEVELTERYDTILLTEVLEHLVNPVDMVAKASSLLAKGGTLIVTVPFGINDFPDHKHTFYMADIVSMLSKYVCVESVEFMGGWIGFCCRECDNPTPLKSFSAEQIEKEEKNFFSLERPLRDRIKHLEEVIRVAKEKHNSEEESFQRCKEELIDSNALLNSKCERLEAELSEQSSLKEDAENKCIAANEQVQRIQHTLESTEKDLDAAKLYAANLQHELETAIEKYEKEKTEESLLIQEQESKIRTLKRRYNTLNNRYNVLKDSLLGKTQLLLWRYKNKLLYKENDDVSIIRNYLKKIPFLKKFVNFLRGNQTYRKYYPTANINIAPLNKKEDEIKTKEESVLLSSEEQLADVLSGLTEKEAYYFGRTDDNYFSRIKPLLDDIKDSNGSRFYEKSKLKVGCVVDEFQYNTYQDVAEFVYLRPDEYSTETDLLMIVSPWRGIDMAWKGIGNPKNRVLREKLLQLMKFYKDQNKPVLFYSKEDPPNYEVFLEIAKESDYIFTSERDCIDDYIRDTKNENVFFLPFSINPLYHNPIGTQKHHLPEIVFSGTWWGYKYEERMQDQVNLMDGVLQAGRKLKLVDRNYELDNMKLAFPTKYLPYVSPSIDHHNLQKVHKLYDWSINLNSVKNSSTMFASRVFEMQALGCSILSNYSKGMNNYFPEIPCVRTAQDVSDIFNSLSDEALYESRMAGIRRAMSKETVFHRFDYILGTIGKCVPDRSRHILVVAEDVEDDAIKRMFNSQTYEHKALIAESALTQEKINEFDSYTFFAPNYEYGAFYLEDMLNAFKYTDSDFITKDSYREKGRLIQGVEHDYIDEFKDRYKTVFWNSVSLDELKENRPNLHGYSIDHLNLNINS